MGCTGSRSRVTGCWVALKIITEVADSTRAVPAGELDMAIVLPPIEASPTGLRNRWPEMPLEQETQLQDYQRE